jgi:hypothetical protein
MLRTGKDGRVEFIDPDGFVQWLRPFSMSSDATNDRIVNYHVKV